MKHLQKFAMLGLLWASVASVAVAQSTTTHTVKRGETLSSVARQYGVSEDALRAANPDAKDLFFVGMKLQIPSGGSGGSAISAPSTGSGGRSVSTSSSSSSSYVRSSSSSSSRSYSSSSDYEDGFAVLALSYQMWLDDKLDNKQKHYYGASFHWNKYISNVFGVGASAAARMNYGIMKGHQTVGSYYVGPNLSAKLSPDGRFFALLPVTAAVSLGDEAKFDGRGGVKYEKAANWGCGVLPMVGVHLGKTTIMAGVDVLFAKETSSALHVSFGFNFM